MKALARALLLGLGLCGLSQPGSATPPDIIDVRDELFGVSRSSLFILRTTRDNLGLHTSEQRDVLLVAIDRATGQETLWPVYRARRIPDEDPGASDTAQKTEVMASPKDVDPYAKLRAAGGYPLGANEGSGRGSVTIENGMIAITDAGGEISRHELAAVLKDASASLDRLADVIGDYPRLAPIRTGDLLRGQSFQADECKVSDPFSHQDGSGVPIRIVRLTCAEPEGQTASLLLRLKGSGSSK